MSRTRNSLIKFATLVKVAGKGADLKAAMITLCNTLHIPQIKNNPANFTPEYLAFFNDHNWNPIQRWAWNFYDSLNNARGDGFPRGMDTETYNAVKSLNEIYYRVSSGRSIPISEGNIDLVIFRIDNPGLAQDPQIEAGIEEIKRIISSADTFIQLSKQPKQEQEQLSIQRTDPRQLQLAQKQYQETNQTYISAVKNVARKFNSLKASLAGGDSKRLNNLIIWAKARFGKLVNNVARIGEVPELEKTKLDAILDTFKKLMNELVSKLIDEEDVPFDIESISLNNEFYLKIEDVEIVEEALDSMINGAINGAKSIKKRRYERADDVKSEKPTSKGTSGKATPNPGGQTRGSPSWTPGCPSWMTPLPLDSLSPLYDPAKSNSLFNRLKLPDSLSPLYDPTYSLFNSLEPPDLKRPRYRIPQK